MTTGARDRTISIPRRLARVGVLLIFGVAIPIGHGVVPWAVSSLAERHGWSDGFPAPWNLSGLIPLASGTGILAWVAYVGLRAVPSRVELGTTSNYLVTDGPYRFTRNPMYVAELSLWLGWTLFFGSVAVALGFVVLLLVMQFLLVPWEERSLRQRLGDRYRLYEATTPRWWRVDRPGRTAGDATRRDA